MSPTCPRLTLPYGITLLDAIAAFEKDEEMSKVTKKSKVVSSSLESFVSISTCYERDERDKEAALLRRSDFVEDQSYCDFCNVPKRLETKECAYVCELCGISTNAESQVQEYREGVSITSAYLYERRNHFRDHLLRLQGKASFAFPLHWILSACAC